MAAPASCANHGVPIMHPIQLACAILGTAASLFAQCSGNPPSVTLSTRSDFTGSFYYGSATPGASLVQFSDWTVNGPISITSMVGLTYDSGLSPTPNQSGATAVVRLYTIPTTYAGNTGTTGTPPAGWTLAGSAT